MPLSHVLGYSDPSKDLRKAVKAKEKAAKKAKKEKKRKGEKAEDLFDPANLAKYKKEIEEKRKLAEALSPGGCVWRSRPILLIVVYGRPLLYSTFKESVAEDFKSTVWVK